MIAIGKKTRRSPPLTWQNQFLELVPDIERYAYFALRGLQPADLEDAVREVVANACCAFQRLAELGKLNLAYASPLARFGVAQFRDGRRIGSRINSRDVYSKCAQSKRGFRLESLDSSGNQAGSWVEILTDNTFTPVPEQAAFRLDFTAWLKQLGRRDRRVAEFLALGHSPSEAALKFQISRARVSQLRAQLRDSWEGLQGANAAFE